MDQDYIKSLIRTYTPYLVTVLVAWLSSLGIHVSDQAKGMLVTGIGIVAGAAYYAIVRLVETKIPAVGKLLGSASTPVYPALDKADPED